jgi:8-oxo-dGTP pyrophosphatase MutT (NUDIX family)
MHRRPVVQLLTAYREANPTEAQVADRILALVESRSDCFDRTCRPGHLTGSAWVVSPDGERHLLLHHRKLDKWLQPGGHADGQTDLAAVALREAVEETGLASLRVVTDREGVAVLDLDVHDIPARYAPDGSLVEDGHEHHDVRFLLRASAEESGCINDESNELRWCTPAEVQALTQEWSVLRLLEKARRRLDC